jgi:O-6-methylguanine DNA methyltransferase
MNTYTTYFQTPLGTCLLQANSDGLTSCKFTNLEQEPILKLNSHLNEHLDLAKKELTEYFDGERKIFTVKLNPSGTLFQKEVWNYLSSIPFGEIENYQSQALSIKNDQKYARAVATANSLNPILLIVPCHRIINKSGDIGGYAFGPKVKKDLILFEALTNTL